VNETEGYEKLSSTVSWFRSYAVSLTNLGEDRARRAPSVVTVTQSPYGIRLVVTCSSCLTERCLPKYGPLQPRVVWEANFIKVFNPGCFNA